MGKIGGAEFGVKVGSWLGSKDGVLNKARLVSTYPGVISLVGACVAVDRLPLDPRILGRLPLEA